jgi:hypothetical protein
MNAPLPLAAIDVVEVVRILIVVVVFVVIMIGKLMSAMRVPQRPPGPARPFVPPPQQPRQAQQPQAQAARPKSVKEEIDEFLSRAAQKKQGPATPTDTTRRIPQPMAPPAQRVEPLKAEVVRERPMGGAVSEQLKKFYAEKGFDQRASKPGGEVAAKPGETAAPRTPRTAGIFQDKPAALPAAGAGLAALLNNIDNLRQAIVLNEILQRPEDRWK